MTPYCKRKNKDGGIIRSDLKLTLTPTLKLTP